MLVSFAAKFSLSYVNSTNCALKKVSTKLSLLSFCFSSRYDFVSIRDGGSTDSPLIGRYCGNVLPTGHLSRGNQLLIRFKSDHSISHEGFRASYRTGK